jgi:hypothetical protein
MTDTVTHEDERLEAEPWGEQLPRRERRRLVTPITAALAAVAIAAAGFIVGVQVQKSQGSAGATAGRVGGLPGAAGGRGAGGQAGQASDATVGEVSSVDGKTFYVDDASGNTIRARAGKGAKVTRNAVSSIGAIHPGDTVIVQGATATSGTVVASTIGATAKNAGNGLGLGGATGGFGGAAGAAAAPGGG